MYQDCLGLVHDRYNILDNILLYLVSFKKGYQGFSY